MVGGRSEEIEKGKREAEWEEKTEQKAAHWGWN